MGGEKVSTIINEVKDDNVPYCIAKIANDEGIEEQQFLHNIITGSVVIPRNNRHASLTPNCHWERYPHQD